MDIVNYLYNIYGYDNPISIKDVRIGGKSKASIRESFSRAVKNGKLIKIGSGIYYIKGKKEFGSVVSFEDIIAKKFLYSKYADSELKQLFVIGYYSANTFANQIHLSDQVPAVLEVTTNNTSSKKRIYTAQGRFAILRKPKAEVNFQNYKILQFLDLLNFISLNEIKDNKELLRDYIKKNQLSKSQFKEYIKLYPFKTLKNITEGGILDAFI